MTTARYPELPKSIADVCEIEVVAAAAAAGDARPAVLIEVPHGATRRRHFEATRRRLVGEYPADLEDFFYVNTDVGSIECARAVAAMVTGPPIHAELGALAGGSGVAPRRAIPSVLILRGLVARTFIDLNRVVAVDPRSTLEPGLTPALPDYVSRAEDVRALEQMHGDYQAAAARAYELVCGAGGIALNLHTYAPRSVAIDRVDGGIVAALRRAYQPATYSSWERRPDVDLISESVKGERLAPRALARAVRANYERIGVEVAENSTYRLDEATLAYVHSHRYTERVLCMEINRELLADPYTPFAEMAISGRKARRMAAPIAAALLGSAGI